MAAAKNPPVEVFFVDCDDCLYQNNWETAKKITNSIAAYTEKLGVSKDQAYQLYKTHGTCLKGLLVEGKIDEQGAETFLHEVHQIDYSDIEPDKALRSAFTRIIGSTPCWIFTASTREHAQRCLERIGLADLDWKGIIDTRSCKLETKHSNSSFVAAMAIAGVTNPAACLFCDDSVKNIVAAKAAGWRTVLVGLQDRDTGAPITCDAADIHIDSLHALPEVLPELFDVVEMKVTTKKSTSFYINCAKRFLQGGEDKDGNKQKAVRALTVSGLGEAINVAVATAAIMQKEGLGKIDTIETSYPQLDAGSSSRGCPLIKLRILRV